MKKILVLSALGIFSAVAVFAFGPQGMGQGMGQGYGQGQGYGMMGKNYGGCGYFNQDNASQLSKEDAVKNVEEYLQENLKGYTVTGVKDYQMPMGTMFEVEVKDASGNEFEFHVNPWGRIMGPFVDENK